MNTPQNGSLEKFKKNGFFEKIESEVEVAKLQAEVKAVRKKMVALPTIRESEAYPDLVSVNEFMSVLVGQHGPIVEEQLNRMPQLEKTILGELVEGVCGDILRAKIYSNKEIVKVADEIFQKAVAFSTRRLALEKKADFAILSLILNKSIDYYKNNGVQSNLYEFPFGEQLQVGGESKQWLSHLKKGDVVDCLKSGGGAKMWSRAVVESAEGASKRVRFFGELISSLVNCPEFEMAPLASRSHDFDWRESLEVGDFVDYCSQFGKWKLCRIDEASDEPNIFGETVKVLVISKANDKSQGSQELSRSAGAVGRKDVVADNFMRAKRSINTKAHSALLAKPETFSKNKHMMINDNEDESLLRLAGEKKHAILRPNLITSGCSSVYFVKYANVFGKHGGFDFICEVVQDKRVSKPETQMFVSHIVENLSESLVAPFVQEKGRAILEWLSSSVGDNIEKNIRLYSSAHLGDFIETVCGMNHRIFAKKEAEKLNCEVMIRVGVVCLKSDILEKQFFGAKKIIEVEERLREGLQTEVRGQLAASLVHNNIFEKIVKGHPNLIDKSTGVLKVLFHSNMISDAEIDSLWEQLRKADSESKSALICMLKSVASDLSVDSTRHLILRMSSSLPEPNPELIDLIASLRRVAVQQNEDDLGRLLYELVWQIYQNSGALKPELSKELTNMLFKTNDPEVLAAYFRKAVNNLLDGKQANRNLKLMGKFVKESKSQLQRVIDIATENNLVDFLINQLVDMHSPSSKDNQEQDDPTAKASRGNGQGEVLRVDKVVKFLRVAHTNCMTSFFDRFVKVEHLTRLFEVVLRLDIRDSSLGEWLRNMLKEAIDESNVVRFQKLFSDNIGQLAQSNNDVSFTNFIVLFMCINQALGCIANKRVKLVNCQNPYKSSQQIVHSNLRPFSAMFGSEALWDCMMACQRKAFYSQIANIVANFHLASEFADKFDDELYEVQRQQLVKRAVELVVADNPCHAQKGCILLLKLIKNEETAKTTGLMSFEQLKEADRVSLILEKVQHYLKERNKVSVPENSTLFQFKETIAQMFKVAFDSVELENEKGQKLMRQDHCLTLEALGLTNCDVVVVGEREAPETSVELTTQDGSDFSDYLKRILLEVFEANCTDGRMRMDQFSKLHDKVKMTSAWEDEKAGLFKKHSSDNGSWMEFDGFVDYFRSQTIGSSDSFYSLKQVFIQLGYYSPIRPRKFEVEDSLDRVRQSLRFRLASDDLFYDKLKGVVSRNCQRLLDREGGDSETDFASRLFHQLPPRFSDTVRAVHDPIGFLEGPMTPLDLYYKPTLLSALLFRDEFAKSVVAKQLVTGREALEGLKRTAVTPAFSKAVVELLNRSAQTAQASFDLGTFPLLKLAERLMKLFVNQKDGFYFDNVKSLMSYFSRRKSKAMAVEQLALEEGQKKAFETKPVLESKAREELDQDDQFILRFDEMLSEGGEPSESQKGVGFGHLCEGLLVLMQSYLSEAGKNTKEDRAFLKALSTDLALAVKLNHDDLETMVVSPRFEDVVVKGLSHKSPLVRMHFKNLYALWCFESPSIKVKTSLLKIIIKALGFKDVEELQGMIELAGMMLADIGETKHKNPEVQKYLHTELNFSELFVKFRDLLLAHKSTELQFDETDDMLMRSYLTFLEKILRTEDSVLAQMDWQDRRRLAEFIFRGCLFQVDHAGISLEAVACKNKRSRASAFDLLRQLLRSDTQLAILFLKTCLLPMSLHLPTFPVQSQLTQDVERRCRNDFGGIHNLGCVCYMLATLQQFYCIPVFRYGLLMASDGQPENTVEHRNRKVDDNLLHQFQKMMAYLDVSDRKDFNPVEFCFAYKDHTGEPTNVSIQMDADEFIKVLLDRLESKLKGSPYLGVLNSVFLGEMVNLITCKNCGHVTVRNENFYSLSLEVKKMASIEESLLKLIEPEIISDYQCDSCKKKCDISKQSMLKKLPNILFLSLKKMYFDLELLANVKLHSRYEFPFSMNLKRYCHQEQEGVPEGEAEDGEEGLKQPSPECPAEDFQYRLAGVVIHKGNAEFGHYTSIINSNRKDPSRPDCSEDKWMEFDDSRVTQFDMKKFEEECFGGTDDKEFGFSAFSPESAMSKSAYLLVYEKAVKDKVVFPFTPATLSERDRLISNLIDKNDVVIADDRVETSFHNLGRFCPEPYLTEILADNRLLSMEQNLQSKIFTNGIAKIVEDLDLEPPHAKSSPAEWTGKQELAGLVLSVLPRFLMKVYSTAYENFQIEKVSEAVLKGLKVLSHVGTCRPEWRQSVATQLSQFFTENLFKKFEETMTIVLHTNDQLLRKTLIDYFCGSVTLLIGFFSIGTLAKPSSTSSSDTQEHFRSQVHECLHVLVSNLIKIDSWNHQNRTIGLLFGVLKKLAESNDCVVQFLADCNFLPFLVRVYTSSDSSTSIGIEKTLVRIVGLIRLVYQFEERKSAFNQDYRDHLGSICKYELLGQCIHEDNREDNFSGMKLMVRDFCLEDKTTTELITMYCLKNFYNRTEVEVLGQLQALQALMLIRDSLALYRVKLVLGVPRLKEAVCRHNNRNWPFFGLGKDTSLASTVCSYLSPFNFEKGLLEWAWNCHLTKPAFVVPIIHFVLEAALESDLVFEYLVHVDPPTYLGGAYYDWVDQYMEYHCSTFDNTPINMRSEFETLFGSSVKNRVHRFKEKVVARFHQSHPPQANLKFFMTESKNYSAGSHLASSRFLEKDSRPLAVWKPQYIVGATKAVRRVAQLTLNDSDGHRLKVTASLVRVPLLVSQPCGWTNLVFPASCIDSSNSVIASNLCTVSPVIRDFFNPQSVTSTNESSSEEEDSDSMSQDETDPRQESPEPSEDSVKQREFVLEVSLKNDSTQSHFLKFRIVNSSSVELLRDETLTLSLKGPSSRVQVFTLTLNDSDSDFKSVKVHVCHKVWESNSMNDYTDEGFSEWEQLLGPSEEKSG
jgi:ubiquitin C-terminal hydrolase